MKTVSKSDDYYLAVCKGMLEEKLGWGSSSDWSHADFMEASERISESTGISLSVTTIKRIWGKITYGGFPSTSTLNALAKYLGYENWRAFKISTDWIEEDEREEKKNPPVKMGKEKNLNQHRKKYILYLPFIFVAILLISIFSFFAKQENSLASTETKVLFSSEPVTKGLPNTVVFNYDISAFDFDSAFIQQNWDPRRRQRIKKNDKQLTSVYYYPGHFNAKLIVNDKTIKEHGLLVPTEGWLGIVSRKGESAPVYIRERNLMEGGVIHASTEVLAENNIDTQKDYQLIYSNTKAYLVDGDNFALEASIKNSLKEGALTCQESYLFIDGEKGIIWFPISIPGCVGNLNLQFGEVAVSGKTTDLSSLGADLNNWNHLRCFVKDRQVKLYLNHKLVHTASYEEPLGEIMGINFGFHGAGVVDFVRLKDSNDKIAYEENF